MAFVRHVGTAVPRHAIAQNVAASAVARSLRLTSERSRSVHALFEHARVGQRYSVLPEAAIGDKLTLSRAMELYRQHALELAVAAAESCLHRAGVDPRRIELLITSSCTGVLLPSLAALLVEPLGLRRNVRRLPLTETGCAGGATALARAHEFSMAFPRAKVLVVAVELPSLTFQADDSSPSNLVASAIFGDGAAAALVEGPGSGGIEILATQTAIVPASLADMGFDLRDGGLHVVLSKDVPRIIAENTPLLVGELLAQSEVSRNDVRFCVLHAGGAKVLEALENGLALGRAQTAASWRILREYGNQSSASVLFVLGEALREGVPEGHGLLAAFGPGITVELALLRGASC